MSFGTAVTGIYTAVKNFLAKNTVRIPATVLVVLNGGNELKWWTLTSAQVTQVNAIVGVVLALFTAGTVTANVRIGDNTVWGGMFGKGDGPAEDVTVDIPAGGGIPTVDVHPAGPLAPAGLDPHAVDPTMVPPVQPVLTDPAAPAAA